MGRPDSSSMATELQLLPNENSISEEKMEWKTRGKEGGFLCDTAKPLLYLFPQLELSNY
jgi:hypothetical protein